VFIKEDKMLCPYCLNAETKVVDKRDFEKISKRRRECLKCQKRFNTKEEVERAELRVIKKDGRREDFNPEKIKKGILIACEKRPIPTDKIDRMMARVEERLIKKGKEIQSALIGEQVMSELKRLDKIAYIRFASVYRDFTDISDFKKELKILVAK
jgi:transcriptional repressor NrdR